LIFAPKDKPYLEAVGIYLDNSHFEEGLWERTRPYLMKDYLQKTKD
jgi:hypothetical protein